MISLSNVTPSPTCKVTPIKVRGKKSTKRKPSFISASLKDSYSNPKRVKRRHEQFLRGSRSRLETLPAEVLEEIFLLSLSPQLALASPYLLVKLSHHHTLLQFATKCFGYLRSELGEHLVVYDDLPLKPDRLVLDARAQILRCPWMSYSFFTRAATLLVERGRQKLQQLAPSQVSHKNFFTELDVWLGPETIFPERLFRAAPTPNRSLFLQKLNMAGVTNGSTNSYISEMVAELILYGVRVQDRNILELDFYEIGMLPSAKQMVIALETTNYNLDIVRAVEKLYHPNDRLSPDTSKKRFLRICATLGPRASERIKHNVRETSEKPPASNRKYI